MKKTEKFVRLRPFKTNGQRKRYLKEKFRQQMRRSMARENPVARSEVTDSMESYLEDLEAKPGKKDLRIYFQNVGTMVLGERGGETSTALKALNAADVSVTCLCEINKNLDNAGVKREMREILKDSIPGAKYHCGSNKKYQPQGRQKPGGLLTVTKRCMDKYVTQRKADPKGRWVKTGLEIEKQRVMVYNTYVPQKQDGGG